MDEKQPMTKRRLQSYLPLRLEKENRLERLKRLKSEAELPPMRESDGSQHTIGRGDRMEKAAIRLMEYAERVRPIIAEIDRELDAIEEAIEALPDPLEREVLRLRYTESDDCQQMRWADVCAAMYGSETESRMRILSDIHRRALEHIGEI